MPLPQKQNPARPPTTTPTRTGKGVLSRIAPIGFDSDDGIKVALYGRSGTGKTTLWATFPDPILAVICSGGLNSGELRSVDTPANRKRISSVQLNSSAEMREIVEHVKTAGTFKTLVVDHVSGLQDLVLKEILGLDELPAQKSWGMASRENYGTCTLQCKELIRALLNLSGNVVLIAHERSFGDGTESDLIAPTIGAAVAPSLAGWLNGAVDYVCQTFIRQKEVVKKVTTGQGKLQKTVEIREKVKGVEYCLRTGPDAVYTTKFRLPRTETDRVPDAIADPNYTKLIKAIRGG